MLCLPCQRHRRGFSLVELVIVIVIIAILAGVATLRFVDLFGTAADAVCQASIARANSAVSVLVARNGGTPPSVYRLSNAGFRKQPQIVGSGGRLSFGNRCVADTYATSDCSGQANNSRDDGVLCVQQVSGMKPGRPGNDSAGRPGDRPRFSSNSR